MTRKTTSKTARKAIHLAPGAGREYAMGSLRAVFKADGGETQKRYSISEWWLEPYTKGPGAHQHEEDDVFFVLEGTMSFFLGGKWIDAPKGSFVIAPGGTPHDFENRTAKRAGALNVSVPGDFEPQMEGIAEWFRARSPEDSRTENAPARKKESIMPTPKKKAAAPKKSAAPKKATTIRAYNAAQPASAKKICVALEKLLDKGLTDKKGEKKIWHGSPVWFLDGNPIAAYAVRKAGVQLLFWSGRDFKEPELLDEGTFKASHVYFTDVSEIKPTALARWLKKAKKIQWDYKNIVKRRGVLEKIGTW